MTIFLNQRLIDTGDYCYATFFTKKYELTDHEKFPKEGNYQGHVIQRPNHGLAHTMRKIYYFSPVIILLALKGITTFSIQQQQFSIIDEAENLLTAYFFSVVGRESEASHTDDPKNYALFRKKSAEAYETYILAKSKTIPTYANLVYSKKITFYKKLIEAPHANNNCIASRLFLICHGLDLSRCYTAAKYSSVLEGIEKALSHEIWKKKYPSINIIKELETYASNCIEATGDLNLALNKPRVSQLFVSCSMSVKECSQALSKVKLPSFMAQALKPKEISVKPVVIPLQPQKAAYVPNKIAPQAGNYAQAKPQPQAPYGQVKAANPAPYAAAPVKQQSPKSDSLTSKYEKAKVLLLNKEYKTALAEFESLSISGFYKGYYQAGLCHYTGQGTSLNYDKAYACFYDGARFKDPNALYMVGLCAYYGRGCSKDLERSQRYFLEAYKCGSNEAKTALNSLFKKNA